MTEFNKYYCNIFIAPGIQCPITITHGVSINYCSLHKLIMNDIEGSGMSSAELHAMAVARGKDLGFALINRAIEKCKNAIHNKLKRKVQEDYDTDSTTDDEDYQVKRPRIIEPESSSKGKESAIKTYTLDEIKQHLSNIYNFEQNKNELEKLRKENRLLNEVIQLRKN
jgi:ribosomal protein RSM22 (predicted rRNA methylase)